MLLHGLGDSSATWEETGQVLGEEWRVYAVDLADMGSKHWPDEYSFELMRDDVLGFLDELDLDRVGIVGHSMGGRRRLPARPGASGTRRAPRPGGNAAAVPQRALGVGRRPEDPIDYDWDVVPAIRAQVWAPDRSGPSCLAEIVAPTLVVTGGLDSSMPQDRIPEMVARIPDSRMTTIPVGHTVHALQPGQFAGAVSEFFTS